MGAASLDMSCAHSTGTIIAVISADAASSALYHGAGERSVLGCVSGSGHCHSFDYDADRQDQDVQESPTRGWRMPVSFPTLTGIRLLEVLPATAL